ncbi:hypothetical protein OSTOST_03460 [Ostertagia ostertagi]
MARPTEHGGTVITYFTHSAKSKNFAVVLLQFFFLLDDDTCQQQRTNLPEWMAYSDPNKNEDGTYTTDVWPKYNGESMEYMNMTVESAYPTSQRTGHGPRREQCAFWKSYLPNLMAKTNVRDWKQ